MPFKSKKQQKFFNANKPELESQGVNVDEWNKTSKGKETPPVAPKKKGATPPPPAKKSGKQVPPGPEKAVPPVKPKKPKSKLKKKAK